MQKLGMVGKDVTAAEIITSVESRKATVWATNPTQSNSGATVPYGWSSARAARSGAAPSSSSSAG